MPKRPTGTDLRLSKRGGRPWLNSSGVDPQVGQLLRLRGWKRAEYEPTKAWPVSGGFSFSTTNHCI